MAEVQDLSAAPAGSESRSTKETVLDAAEALFAQHGFAQTTLNEVGLAAGVSRGTPGYLFGSKADLYNAVLDRCLGQVRAAIEIGRVRAIASGEPPDRVLAGVVGEYFDFITSHPHLIRLIEWEALTGGPSAAELPRHVAVAQQALAALQEELPFAPDHPESTVQLLLSVIGLTWFPLVHSGTILQALGVDLTSPGFLLARKRHVISLVLSGMGSTAHRGSLPIP